MPHHRLQHLFQTTFRLIPLLLILIQTSVCTRKPFDPGQQATFNEDNFTFQPVLESATIWQVAAASSPDGDLAIAAATAYRELKLLERSAGAWSTITTLSGEGLHPSSIGLAPGPGGAWWVLATDTEYGAKLYRVGGAGDSTLVIPKYKSIDWDSTGTIVLASNSQGNPVAILHAGSEGLIRAALADTGWALSEIPTTSTYSTVDDFTIDPLGQEHLVFHRTGQDPGQFMKVGIDSTISGEILNSAENLALAVSTDGFPFITGSVGYQNNLLVWQLLGTDDLGYFWESEVLTLFEEELYVGNFDICLNSNGKPFVAYAIWEGPARFTIRMATRDAGTLYGWEFESIVQGLERVCATNRMMMFRVVIDDQDTPHFFFLSGDSVSTTSSLWEAVWNSG